MKNLLRRLTAVFFALVLCLTSASALTVEEAIELLKANYVDELPAAVYEAETLDELFTALGDPYTYFMSDAEYEKFTSSVENETTVCGIGASIEYRRDGIHITSVLAGGGATEAGIVPGDVIVAVEGESCAPAGEQHRAMIIGEPGTSVTITVRHADGTTQDYRIERRYITLRNTDVTFRDGVGSIECRSFGSNTGGYFEDGMAEHADDARVWIVDLRSNVGGFADSAVRALGAFTGFGPKLYYRLRDASTLYSLYLTAPTTDKPAIVLVDGLSASASEILTGGIRAAGAGIVIGSRTYGKGTAQIILDHANRPEYFEDGGSLKVTAYRFFCSDGNTTDKIGVVPTLLVAGQYTERVAQLLTAQSSGEGDRLTLTLNGCVFHVDLSQAASEEYAPAFGELLSALPPDFEATVTRADGETEALSSAELLARYAPTAVSRRFADVSASPYAVEIDTLGIYGILQGDGDGHFGPGSALTRAELCAMLAQALNVSAKSTGRFADVSEDAWYVGSVAAMSRLGFVDGVDETRFAPDDTLTQEQFITIMGRLARFLNFNVDDYALALNEDELDADGELAPFAPWAREGVCVMTRCEGGNMLYAQREEIDPRAAVTREQAAASLCRMFKVLGILAY